MRFKRLSIEQGLSQSGVFCVLEDRKGYLWIGTSDGLNRFDGYEVTVFKHEPGNPNSLPGNNITAIAEDKSGNLWIGTHNSGLVKYNQALRKFTSYIKDRDNFKGPLSKSITCLFTDSKGRIWVGTRDAGLSLYDPQADRFRYFKYRRDNPNSISSNHITSLAEDNQGRIWMGTPGNGISCLDLATGKINRSFFAEGDSTETMGKEIAGFFHLRDEKESLHCLDLNGRFYRIDAASKTYTQVFHWASEVINSEPSTVQSILVDRFGKIWVGGNSSGLFMINTETHEVKHSIANHHDPFSLSTNFVSCIFQDRTGLVWIGTNGGGINIYNPRSAQFKNFSQYIFDGESLPDNDVWAIAGIGNDLLVGTSAGGLVRLDPRAGKYQKFQMREKPFNQEGAGFILNVKQTPNGDIFAATQGDGIHVYSAAGVWKYALRYEPHNPNSIMGNFIRTLWVSPGGILWIAVKGKGINSFNPRTKEIRAFPAEPGEKFALSNSRINDIMMDERGRLIVGHSQGIDILDTATGKFTQITRDSKRPFSLGNEEVLSLFSDKNHLLWVGTSGGINVMHPSGRFLMIDEAGGLPNEMIYGITQDKKGNIWFSTNKGICRITPPNPDWIMSNPGRYLVEMKKSIRNYDISEGINSNEFNANAVFSDASGILYFGGLGGVSAINTDSISDNFQELLVDISSFKVFGKEFNISPLDTVISLRYNENYLSFDFLAINLLNAQPTQYVYMLSGFDKDWIYSGKRRFASYTNLEPGEYVFRVKATTGNGNWSGKEQTLKIMIRKPFWKKGWFYFFVITTSIGLVWLFIFLRERKLNSDKQKLENLVEDRTQELRLAKEQAENSMRAKEMFLSTMSHEIRTPLNAVIAMSQLLIEEKPRPEQMENIQTLKFSSENLLVLINDILDFSKIDAGKIEFEEVPINIRELIRGLRRALQPSADEKNIELITHIQDSVPQIFLGDPVRLNQVLTNLVSNGLKFTIIGSVRLDVNLISADDEQCEIAFSITDTGIGIHPDKFSQIFESFEQASKDTTRKFGGTGLGLTITKRLLELQGSNIMLESEVGKGSRFFFSLRFKRLNGLVSNVAKSYEVNEKALHGLQVLLVEDNSINRLIVSKFLSKWGVALEFAENGVIAVEMATISQYDLILMDLQMPEMDGFEATRNIRNIGSHWSSNVPILALTAAAMVEVKEQVINAGMNDYIAKPFNSEELFTKIAAHSGRLS
jgi:signal transduction histidine kinase/ligand-binding sensor domain-containing protein/CheY-like chemotaxis protein